MTNSYEITQVRLRDQLVRILGTTGSKTFLEHLWDRPKTKERAAAIAHMMYRVAASGTTWAIASAKLKFLSTSSGVSVYELRLNGKVIRIMTYIHDDERKTPVYLFDFDGHRGKKGSIPQPILEKGMRLAAIARECMEHEEEK